MKRTPTARWHAALSPIIAHIKVHPEAKRELLDILHRNGYPLARQQLNAYLTPVQGKRQEPRLGAGLALLEAAAEVMQPRLETSLKLMRNLPVFQGAWTTLDKNH